MHPEYDIEKNMTNHPPVGEHIVAKFEEIRIHFKNCAQTVLDNCPASRERSLAFTNLEQALMWAIASIARNQDPNEGDN